MFLLLHIVLCVVVVVKASSPSNLVTNGDFESSSTSHWVCRDCSMHVSSDSHDGHKALKVNSRHGDATGPSQTVAVKRGTRYRVQAYVKQANDVTTKLLQTYSLRLSCHWTDGSADALKMSQHSNTRSRNGYFSMIGFFMVPDKAIRDANLHLLGPEAAINYLLDDVSLTEIAEDTNWEAEANARIDSIRKGDIHIKLHLPHSMNPADVSVQVDLKKHQFRFGSLVKDEYILESQYQGYQQFAFSLFNLISLQSFKWKFDKGTQNHPDYTQAVAAMHRAKQHGLDVRGHNLFWGFVKNLPDWVPSLPIHQLNVTIQNRLHYMINITKGQLVQWDVMNELTHGQWFEETFKDPDFSQNLFRQVKALDPVPTLMLNDFHMAAEPDCTDDYLQQAQMFLAEGVPLEALGLQSHFKEDQPPDPTLMKLRLDHLSRSGLPLWITELNLMDHDPVVKADYYERAFRVYFSHPSVQGIVLWGFWDHEGQNPLTALVEGFQFKINEAGSRIVRLIQEEWSTHVNQTLTSGSGQVNVRGFKGDYDVVVSVKGMPVKVRSFTLSGQSVDVNITLTGHEGTVSLPQPLPTLLTPNSVVTGSSTGDIVLGQSSSSSSSPLSLACTTRLSPFSRPGDNEQTQVTCQTGEVMTGCSSILQNHDWRRDGERIEVSQGVIACVALNGYRSTQGIQAAAVCCKARDLTCTYRSAGPSDSGHDVTVRTACDANQHALGCSAWNYHSRIGGVNATNSACIAYNQDTQSGVYVYGTCCSAPQLSCVTVTSAPSGRHKGDGTHVQCDAGYVMTSCNVVASHGQSSGAYITGTSHPVCQAYNGRFLDPNQPGVRALAVCCRQLDSQMVG